jgi:putative endonuclease
MRQPVVYILASNRLIFVESHETAPDAIAREKQLKGWRRSKKIALINRSNPDWRDLSGEIHTDG